MAKRSKKQEQGPQVGRHITPYEVHYQSEVWQAVDRALTDLEENGDLEISTYRDLVVGLITQRIEEKRTAKLKAKAASGPVQTVESRKPLKSATLKRKTDSPLPLVAAPHA